MPAAGFKAKMAIGKETTWGTPVTTTEIVPLLSEGITKEISEITRDELVGKAGLDPSYPGHVTIGGSISSQLSYQDTDILLAAALGGGAGDPVDLSNEGKGPWLHKIQLAEDIARSLTLAIDLGLSGNNFWNIKGCKINKMTIKGSAGGTVTLDLDIVAKDKWRSSIFAGNYLNAPRVLFSHLTFRIGDIDYALGDGNIVGISEFELTLENNLKTDDYTSSSGQYIEEPVRNGKRKVTFKIKMPRANALDWFDKAVSYDKLQADLRFSYKNYEVYISLPTLIITKAPNFNVGGAELIPVEFEMTAFRNDGNTWMADVTEEFQIQITNQRETAIW